MTSIKQFVAKKRRKKVELGGLIYASSSNRKFFQNDFRVKALRKEIGETGLRKLLDCHSGVNPFRKAIESSHDGILWNLQDGTKVWLKGNGSKCYVQKPGERFLEKYPELAMLHDKQRRDQELKQEHEEIQKREQEISREGSNFTENKHVTVGDQTVIIPKGAISAKITTQKPGSEMIETKLDFGPTPPDKDMREEMDTADFLEQEQWKAEQEKAKTSKKKQDAMNIEALVRELVEKAMKNMAQSE